MKNSFVSLCLGGAMALSAHAATVNVALDAPAYANGPLFGAQPIVRLTDGGRLTVFHGDVAPPTGFAYWVDLGTNRSIDNIKIYPRQDNCCPDRLSNFRVSVHNDDGAGSIGPEVWRANLYTNGTNPGSALGTVVTVIASAGTGTFAGRWVQIKALADPVPDYALQITELEVYANGLRNLAQGAAASANGPLWGPFTIAQLTDGDRGGVLHGAETEPVGFAYQVDLGVDVQIDNIRVIARQDGCCPERLSNYKLSVHNHGGTGPGAEVWSAIVHGDASTAGSGPGAKDVIRADSDPGGVFAGRWVRIQALQDPVPAYALQMNELEVYGTAGAGVNLTLTQQPVDQISVPPLSVNFRVGANAVNGDNSLITYQWQRDRVNIPGGTNATYTVQLLSYTDANSRYRAVVSYPGVTSLTSDEAGIIINHARDTLPYNNQPLWPPGNWNIQMLVDGNRSAALHGDVTIQPGFAYEVNLGAEVDMSRIDIYARQDGCCPERLTKFRVTLHQDTNGAIGPQVWSVDLFADGTNPGSATGAKVSISNSLDPAGVFKGQWIRIQSLEDPVQSYALQMSELEVFGSLSPGLKLFITRQPQDFSTAPYRSATFSVGVKAFNGNATNVAYQWQKNGADIPGATGATFTTPLLRQTDENAAYRARISYPGLVSVLSTEGKVIFDYNFARGAQAFSNRPLWVPGNWNIQMLVDGNRSTVFHGHESIAPGFAYTVNLGVPVLLERIDIYPRQDGCCAGRFSNLRVSVHEDLNGAIGPERWGADLYADGTNPGSAANTIVSVFPEADPGGVFSGQWLQIRSLENPVQNYALQMTEVEAYGRALAIDASYTSGNLRLNWPVGGVLESAVEITGPWGPVSGATSNLLVNVTTGRRFYRLSH